MRTCARCLIVSAIAVFAFSLSASAEPLEVCVVAEQPTWSFRYLKATLTQSVEFRVASVILDGSKTVPRELPKCSVLILVDVSPATFSRQPEFADSLTNFVSEGGGLIIAPGESWRGQPLPLTKLLPVQADDGKLETNDAPDLSRPRVTGAGLRSSILRLVDDPMRNQQLWREELDACFGKPLSVSPHRNATVLAVDPRRRLNERKIPLIATREVGDGNVVFLNNSQAWRWRAKPVGNYHGRFWKQLVQFVAKEP